MSMAWTKSAAEHYAGTYTFEDEDGSHVPSDVRLVKRRKDRRGVEEPCEPHEKVPRHMEKVWKSKIPKEFPFEACKTPQLKCDKYDPELSDRPIKIDINLKYLTYLQRYFREDRRVVVLDSPVALTTQTLSSLIPADRLHVPNPDPKFLKKAPRHFSKMAIYSNETVYFWCLRNAAQHQYDFALDYTCTFFGDQDVKPLADIAVILEKKLLPKHNGILWLTVSRRRKGGHNTSTQVHEFLAKKGASEGYTFECLEEQKYGGGMLYFFFRTVQNTAPLMFQGPSWKQVSQLQLKPQALLPIEERSKAKIIGQKRKREVSPAPITAKRRRTKSLAQVKTRSQSCKDTFTVDRLLDVRETADGKRLYLVKWQGFARKNATWEPASHLRNHKKEMSVLDKKLNTA